MSEIDPIVGNWYKNLEDESEFEVVAVDDGAQTVQIQYFDGEVEEIDQDAWYELALETIAEPEDWSGAYDEMEADDLGYEETGKSARRDDPLKNLY